jgi:hypothetical protein
VDKEWIFESFFSGLDRSVREATAKEQLAIAMTRHCLLDDSIPFLTLEHKNTMSATCRHCTS